MDGTTVESGISSTILDVKTDTMYKRDQPPLKKKNSILYTMKLEQLNLMNYDHEYYTRTEFFLCRKLVLNFLCVC